MPSSSLVYYDNNKLYNNVFYFFYFTCFDHSITPISWKEGEIWFNEIADNTGQGLVDFCFLNPWISRLILNFQYVIKTFVKGFIITYILDLLPGFKCDNRSFSCVCVKGDKLLQHPLWKESEIN